MRDEGFIVARISLFDLMFWDKQKEKAKIICISKGLQSDTKSQTVAWFNMATHWYI
jgi:hypothetical protein